MTEQGEKSQNIEEEMLESIKRICQAGLGAIAVAGEEGSKMFKNLAEMGGSLDETIKKAAEEMKQPFGAAKAKSESKWEDLEDLLNRKSEKVTKSLNLATKADLRELAEKVEALTKSVEEMARKAEQPS